MGSSPPSPAGSAAPAWLRTAGTSAWYLVGLGLAIWGLAELAQKLTVAVLPVLAALLLAGVLEPFVRRIGRTGWPEWIAPLIVVLALLLVIVALVVGVGVRLNDQLPALEQDLRSAAQDAEERFGVQLPGVGESSGSAPASGSSGSSSSGSSSDGFLPGFSEALRLGTEILFGFFLTLAFTFLFLKDGAKMWGWFTAKLGTGIRGEVDRAGRAAWGTVGSYMRGLSLVAAFDSIGIAVGLLLLGVPLVLTLAALQFVGSYIPTIGAFVAGAAAVVVAYSSGGLVTAGLTVALVIVVQQIGNDVIEPWVLGHTIPLHPAVILLAVTIGGALWGIPGALLFVPLAAAMSAAGHVLWSHHQDRSPEPEGA